MSATTLPNHIKWNTDFDSSNVQGVAHDELTGDLYVSFHNGTNYKYFKVPKDEFERLTQAESVGRHLNARIKPVYDYERL